MAFVNKMDRAGADYMRVVNQLRERLGANPVVCQLPIGTEDDFRGIIDLARMKAIYWDDETKGARFEEAEIPPQALADEAASYRAKLVEAAADGSDELTEKFLEESELGADEIKAGLRALTIANKAVCVLCGSAFKNKGVQAMLDAVIDYMPNPRDVPPVIGTGDDGGEMTLGAGDKEPFSALAFKIATDPFIGQLVFFRVYSGVLASGDAVYIPVKRRRERIGRLLQMHANERREIKEVRAGDIAAAVGLKDIATGDTLCAENIRITLECMEFPDPVISQAVEPRTKADQERLGMALGKLAQEDPSFRVHTDQESNQTIISGMGELHLEIIIDRLKREFSVASNVGKPQVAYRETIGGSVEQEHKHARQTGGRGQYGHVFVRVEPLERGAGFEFVDAIKGGVIPREYIPGGAKGHQGSDGGRHHRRLPGGGRQGYFVRRLLPRGGFLGVRVQDRWQPWPSRRRCAAPHRCCWSRSCRLRW